MSTCIKILSLFIFVCGLLNGCGSLMPVGAVFGAGRSGGQMPAGGQPPNPNPERLVYRIDDHRYITIRADETCAGGIVYHDTNLGIRTGVAATGFNLGYGVAKGRYAIDSTYIAIPALGWSDLSGGTLHIYYSFDQGRTFHKLWIGGETDDGAKISVKDKYLYIYYNKYDAIKFDVSREIPLDDFGHALNWWTYAIHPKTAPQDIHSPSGMDGIFCGEPIIAQ